MAAAMVPSARRAVRANLRRIRGPASPARDAREVLETFSTYASCLAEVLSNDAPGGPRLAHATVRGELHMQDARSLGKGVVLATAHTAGWESAGPLLVRHHGLDVMLVMQAEPDERAMRIHDHAREASGLEIAHVGESPFASLPLLKHLKKGGAVALQIDRVAPGMRTRRVRFLDEDDGIPEGALKLAQLTGAPILPVFCARVAHRRYLIAAYEPRVVPRRATEKDLDDVAQHLATCLTSFLREHPTQWFQFRNT
jgi:KDO2-lipid IV(A) lauroyltransferase